QVNSNDPVGPDNYGYYMFDNTDVDYDLAPTYEWIEINPSLGGQGTRLSFSESDDASVLINLPFDVQYYGQTYGHMIVCTNGFVDFDTIPYDMAGHYWFNWANYPIPDPGCAKAQISPFWDDLKYTGSTHGVYTYYDEDNDRFIIEWSGMTHANTSSPETFQMIIYDPAEYPTPTGDAEFVFQYHTIYNNDSGGSDANRPESYSSVGFENWDEDDGLQYEYDNVYHPGAATLQAGRAIKITTATTSSFCDYVPGDANGDGSVMGNDVTYSVRYFKGLGDPPPDSCPYNGGWLYSAGDANGNCSYTGSDVTFLVGYFKGLNPEVLWCPDTPPPVYLNPILRHGTTPASQR
ncbi:MAG: hypothetical protein B6D58_07485, partial [candidate division Zixibacteria bacterium 4484_95]